MTNGYLSNGGNGALAVPITAAKKLRSMLEAGDDIIFCPGVYDGFSARIALSVGFDAIYMVSQRNTLLNVLCTPFSVSRGPLPKTFSILMVSSYLDGSWNQRFETGSC